MRNTIIKDPAIHPFYLSKDQYCYTIMEVVTPDAKNLGRFGNKGNKNEGKDYEKALGHYSSLGAALNKVAKLKVDTQENYDSILEYIQQFEMQKDEMSKLLTKIRI